MNNNKVVYEYNSTIEGSKLTFYCEDNPDEIYMAQCYRNGTWTPNIALITCSGQSTVGKEYKCCYIIEPNLSYHNTCMHLACTCEAL